MKHYFVPILTASMLVGVGCTASEEPLSPFQDDTVPINDIATAGSTGASTASCTIINQTKPCSCGSLTGRQVCLGSDWSDCQCFSEDGGPAIDLGGQIVDNGSNLTTPSGNLREDLNFDWLRTPPVGGTCMPGHYEGTFECELSDGTSSWGMVKGPVTIVLERSEINGEYLEIADGNMDGFVEEWFSPITAKLEGRLDCTTTKFEANTVDGEYLMISFMPGPFNGVLEGQYNRLSLQLTGEWHLIDDFHVGFDCLGPWHVDYVGP